jgi:hypothetical protein
VCATKHDPCCMTKHVLTSAVEWPEKPSVAVALAEMPSVLARRLKFDGAAAQSRVPSSHKGHFPPTPAVVAIDPILKTPVSNDEIMLDGWLELISRRRTSQQDGSVIIHRFYSRQNVQKKLIHAFFALSTHTILAPRQQ